MQNALCTLMWLSLTLVVAARTTGTEVETNRPSPLVTTESRYENATLVAGDADANLTFAVAGNTNELVVPARKVVRWGSFAAAKGGHRVRLVGGGELVCYSVAIDDREITFQSDLLDIVTLPRTAVAAVIFDQPADDSSARALEKRIQNTPSDNDTLLMANGDRLVGRLGGLANDQLNLKTSATDFAVERSRAAAVVFGRTKREEQPEALQAWIGLRDGSRFLADRLTLKEGKAALQLAAAGAVSLGGDAITALQPIGGETVYLSDLADAGYRHIPFLSLAWDFARDRNVSGGPLAADGRLHLKGLGMHSAARITYDLGGDYRAFQSELAIDDSTGGRGSVTCRVFVDDGSGKWRLKYESPIIRGGDKPVPVEVDLDGVKRISLLVDFSDRGDVLDHINWLDSRLVK